MQAYITGRNETFKYLVLQIRENDKSPNFRFFLENIKETQWAEFN